MGKSGALSTSNQYVKYTIEIIQNSQNIPTNTSNVTVKVRFYRTNTGYETYGNGTVYCKINGVTYNASVSSSQKITNSGIVLFSKTLSVAHGADGKKTLTCSAWINIDAPLTSSEQSYSQALTTIPRNAKITTFKVDKLDETSLKVTWNCDVACDKVYYSLNGGGWVEGVGYPSFSIAGLTANTSYSVKIRVRRKDNQLLTDSSAISQTTYNYPHCNSAPNFNIGDKVTLGFYNPLGRTISVYLVLADGTQEGGDTISGTTLSGYNGSGWKNYLYNSIPNAKSGKYKVKVVYGSRTFVYDKSNTYAIRGNETPTINSVTYKDIDTSVVVITGDEQAIVQNQSNLQINYTAATPNFGAGSIAKYEFAINGVVKTSTASGGTVNFGKINSATDVELNITVTDSRGVVATKTQTIEMVPHSAPTAVVTLERVNNYEDETHLTVDASMADVNGKNSVTVQYRYKLSNDEYSDFVAIPNKEMQVLTLDKHHIFVFNVKVTDAFGAVLDAEYILYKGVFPLFIDTEKNAVGINEFPAEGEALRVAGGVAHFDGGVKVGDDLLQDFIVEQATVGIWTYRKWYSGNVDMECVVSNTSATADELVEVIIDLPFAVSKVKPYVSCLASGWALTKPPYFNIYGGNSVTDNCVELKLYYTAANATSRAYYFAIQVRGTWR